MSSHRPVYVVRAEPLENRLFCRMVNLSSLGLLIAAVLSLAPAAGAAVINHVEYGASVILPESINKTDSKDSGETVTAGSGLLQSNVGAVTASAIAFASAAPGHIGVSIGGTANVGDGGGASAVVAANAKASWSEFIVLKSFKLGFGHPVRVHAGTQLFGNMSATAGPFGAAHITLIAGNQQFSVKTANVSGGPIDQQAPSFFSFTLLMHNQEDHSLNADLSISGLAQSGSGLAEFVGNYRNSLHWGGVDFVEDAITGEIIDDWTITSESGTDYAHPVGIPEPSSLALLAVAALPGLIRTRKERDK